jgi:hypothetical protein
MELALAQAATFTRAAAAPRAKGVVKQVQAWTLSELIAVAREMRGLSEDVARHADHVRNFRNYIHPRQQLKESFEPRIETARIAQQVLRAALIDLENLGGTRCRCFRTRDGHISGFPRPRRAEATPRKPPRSHARPRDTPAEEAHTTRRNIRDTSVVCRTHPVQHSQVINVRFRLLWAAHEPTALQADPKLRYGLAGHT